MRTANKYLTATILLLLLVSCRRKALVISDYMRHIENQENGLHKIVVVDGWEYNIQYKPHEYMVTQEMKGGNNDSLFNARMQQLKGTAWFNLSFKKQGSNTSPLKYNATSIAEYDTRYNYYLNEAIHDIALVYGKDTLHPISYLFETSYNLAPVETIVAGFALTGNDSCALQNMQLVFFDRVFRNGIIKASFNKELLQQIPAIKR